MAVVKNLMVRAGADFSAITKQASKASQSMRGMQSSVSRSCSLMSKAASGVKKVLGAVGIALSVASIVRYGKEAAKAYDAQMQSEMRLATVMRNTMGATNAEIQSIMDLTAAEQQLGVVGDEVQLAGAQQLATYLHLSSSLQTLIPVMNDLAVQQYGLNVSEEQAVSIAKLFGKAMEGNTGALTRYGLSLSAAQQQVMKYGSEEERAATLADIVRARVGGMNAALASTPSGRMQQLGNALGDVKEKFGQAVRTLGTVFLPILNAVGTALAGIATIANKVAQAIANVFGGSVAGKEWQWAGVTAGISDTADAVDDLTDAQEGSAGAAKKQKEALQTASFDTLNILKATDAAGGGGGGGGYGGGGSGRDPISETSTAATEAGGSLGWLQEKLEKLKTKWEDFKAKLDFTRLKASWGELTGAISEFGSAVGEILGPVWDNILEPLAVWTINKALPTMLEWLANAIKGLKAIVVSAKEFIEKAWGDISEFFKRTGEKIKTIWNNAVSSIRDSFAGAKESIQTIWGNLGTRFNSFGQKVKDSWNNAIGSIKNSTDKAKEAISTGLQNLGTSAKDFGQRIKNAWGDIRTSFSIGKDSISTGLQNLVASFRDSDKSIINSFTDLTRRIGTAWNDIRESLTRGKESIRTGLQNISDSIKNIGQKIYDGFTWPFQKAYNWISEIIDKIKNLLNFDWSIPRPKIPHIKWKFDKMNFAGMSIPIPKFSVEWYARGGVFDRASLIGVGENGKEAVVPLERNTGWISRIASELAAQMAGGAGLLGGEALIEGIHDAVYEAMMSVMGMQSRSGSHETVLSVNGREFFRAVWDDYKAVAKERGVSLVNT